MQPLSRTELRSLRALTHQSVRLRRGAFLLEGVRALDTALQFPAMVRLVAATKEAAAQPAVGPLLEKAVAGGVQVRSLVPEQLAELADTKTPSGLIGCIAWEPVREPEPKRLIADLEKAGAGRLLCLDAVGDPGNVGSLLRAADAFGVDAVLLGRGTVEVTNPKVVRAAVGSLFHLPYVAEGVSLMPPLELLQERGWTVYRAEAHGGSAPPSEPPSKPWVLLLGSEAHGVDPELCSIGRAIHIPIRGGAESLNVAMAGGILLYALSHQRRRHG